MCLGGPSKVNVPKPAPLPPPLPAPPPPKPAPTPPKLLQTPGQTPDIRIGGAKKKSSDRSSARRSSQSLTISGDNQGLNL